MLLRFVVFLLGSLLGLGASVWDFPGSRGSDCFVHICLNDGEESKHAHLSASAFNKNHIDFSNRVSGSLI